MACAAQTFIPARSRKKGSGRTGRTHISRRLASLLLHHVLRTLKKCEERTPVLENGEDRKTPMVLPDATYGPARFNRKMRLEKATGEAKTMPVLDASCLINEQPGSQTGKRLLPAAWELEDGEGKRIAIIVSCVS